MQQLSIRTSRTDVSPPVAAGLSLSLALALGPWFALALAPCAAAAAVDLRTRRIPNRLVAIGALVVVASSAISGEAQAAGIGSLAFAAPLLVLHLIAPPAMGFGDVKLAFVLGGALGAVEPTLAPLALCIAAGGTLAVSIPRRRTEFAFAPGLVFGTLVAVALHALGGAP